MLSAGVGCLPPHPTPPPYRSPSPSAYSSVVTRSRIGPSALFARLFESSHSCENTAVSPSTAGGWRICTPPAPTTTHRKAGGSRRGLGPRRPPRPATRVLESATSVNQNEIERALYWGVDFWFGGVLNGEATVAGAVVWACACTTAATASTHAKAMRDASFVFMSVSLDGPDLSSSLFGSRLGIGHGGHDLVHVEVEAFLPRWKCLEALGEFQYFGDRWRQRP